FFTVVFRYLAEFVIYIGDTPSLISGRNNSGLVKGILQISQLFQKIAVRRRLSPFANWFGRLRLHSCPISSICNGVDREKYPGVLLLVSDFRLSARLPGVQVRILPFQERHLGREAQNLKRCQRDLRNHTGAGRPEGEKLSLARFPRGSMPAR